MNPRLKFIVFNIIDPVSVKVVVVIYSIVFKATLFNFRSFILLFSSFIRESWILCNVMNTVNA